MSDTLTPTGASAQQLSDLVCGIARALADDPERVRVESDTVDSAMTIRLFVAENDLVKMVGKQGRTVRSLRSILGAAANKLQLCCALDIRSE